MGIQLKRVVGSALVLLIPLLGLTLYLTEGSSETPVAEARIQLPVEAVARSGPADGAEVHRLRAHLERQPRDARAWVILARIEAETDRFEAAAQAYKNALAIRSKVAEDPAVWCEYADALGMTQGGNLAGRPRELIDRALTLDPNHPKALELAGSSEYERGDYAAALRFWRPLLGAQQPGSQMHAELVAAIARTERLAATTIAAKRH